MRKTVYDVLKAATMRQAALACAALLALMGTGLVTVGRTAADHGLRALPSWDSLSRVVARVDSIQQSDRARADSLAEFEMRWKAVMIDANPELREQVRRVADASESTARRQRENIELLNRIGGAR